MSSEPHPPGIPRAVVRSARGQRRARQQLWGFAFLLPMLSLLILFKLLPMGHALYLSLTTYDLLSPPRFVGLRNYAALWHDPLFHQSAGVTLYYVLGTCVPLWGLALLLALVLNRPWPARGALRLAYFLPAVVPPVVHAIIWRFLFHPYGLLNRGLETLGLPAIAWLADSRAVVPGFILANLWRFAPYFMVVYLAGLQSIPAEYYEAASIDGASPGQQFRHITLPLLRPTILLVFVVSTILMSKIFTSVLIVSNGGPDGASRVLALFIYQTGFQYLKMGLACAASVCLLLATMGFTLVQLRLLRSADRG